MDDALPRPSLVYFALSTLIIGFCAMVAGTEAIRFFQPWGFNFLVATYSTLLLIAQTLSSFGRARWAAWMCTVLIAILLLSSIPTIIMHATNRIVPFRGPILARLLSFTALLAVATLANGQWALKLHAAKARSGFIRRYSLAELGTVFTILCAVAAVAGKMYSER